MATQTTARLPRLSRSGPSSGTSQSVLPPGTMLGKYRLVGQLGQGGMGVVYEALDTRLQRRVAIKILPPALATEPKARELFLSEARAACRVEHPNVVGVYEADESNGVPFLAMQLVSGGSAAEFIRKRGPFNWPEATRIICDACRGLAAAHAAGLIHRDIKPGNILRGRDGTVKLTDFGLALFGEAPSDGETLVDSAAAGDELRAGREYLPTTDMAGTPAFMSPEQIRGQSLDARSDLYALGATFYALLTGEPPFPRSQTVETLRAHCVEPPPDPRKVRPEIPATIVRLIHRAMAKSPHDRPSTANELLLELEGVLSQPSNTVVDMLANGDDWAKFLLSQPSGWPSENAIPAGTNVRPTEASAIAYGQPLTATRGHRGSTLYLSRSRTDRSATVRAAMFLSGTLLVVTMGGGLLYAVFSDSEPPNHMAVKTTPTTVEPGGESSTELGLGTEYATHVTSEPPDPVLLEFEGLLKSAHAVPDSPDIQDRHAVVRALQAFRDRYAGSEVVRHRQAASEAERVLVQLAAESPPMSVELLNVEYHQPLKARPAVVAWHPKGDSILIGYADGQVERLDEKGTDGARRLGHADAVTALAISPDGTRLATAGKDKTIILWSLPQLEVEARLLGHTETVTSVAFAPDGPTLVSGAEDKSIRVWNLYKPDEPAEVLTNAHTDCVNAVVFVPRNRDKLLTVSCDKSAAIWDWSQRKMVATLESYSHPIVAGVVSQDGCVFAYVGSNGVVGLYDLAAGAKRNSLLPIVPHRRGQQSMISGLAIAPQEPWLVVSPVDSWTVMWDVTTARARYLLYDERNRKPTEQLSQVAFSPDGRKLVGVGPIPLLRFWTVPVHKPAEPE